MRHVTLAPTKYIICPVTRPYGLSTSEVVKIDLLGQSLGRVTGLAFLSRVALALDATCCQDSRKSLRFVDLSSCENRSLGPAMDVTCCRVNEAFLSQHHADYRADHSNSLMHQHNTCDALRGLLTVDQDEEIRKLLSMFSSRPNPLVHMPTERLTQSWDAAGGTRAAGATPGRVVSWTRTCRE
jgi:hypothetical protein